MKSRACETPAAARPKKIDARILVNPATGMIYTSRRLSAEWKRRAHRARGPRKRGETGETARRGRRRRWRWPFLASLRRRAKGEKSRFDPEPGIWDRTQTVGLPSLHVSPGSLKLRSLMTSELVSFRIKTPESSLLITSSKPTRNGTRSRAASAAAARSGYGPGV